MDEKRMKIDELIAELDARCTTESDAWYIMNELGSKLGYVAFEGIDYEFTDSFDMDNGMSCQTIHVYTPLEEDE